MNVSFSNPNKVLVIYYSQTGQLKHVIQAITAPIVEQLTIKVDYYSIKPTPVYPFPWTSAAFFDEFPECVKEIPCAIEAPDLSTDYDLIILAYQPWFLSISRPVNSFLQLLSTQKLFKGKKVVTVIGCRNMWTQAQEMMKQRLHILNAELVGNIVLCDKAWNLVSVYTVLRWMFYGKKGNSGISQKDIVDARVFGQYISQQLMNTKPVKQKELHALGAVHSINSLIFIEKRAIILFRLFANLILKGGASGSKRQKKLLLFKIYLFAGIIILSPFSFFIAKVRELLFFKSANKEKAYFEGINK